MEQDDAGSPELEITSLEPSTGRRERLKSATHLLRSWPGRLALSALTLLVILGALAAMFARASSDPISEARNALGLSTPTPTPLIPPGGDTFGLTDTVPWGDLRIDGHAPTLTTIAPVGRGFTLPRGAHHLVYQARYFPPLRCVISVPQSPDDTCPLANVSGTTDITYQRVLDLHAMPNRMSGGQYELLVSAVSAALDTYSASTTIEPGERYINRSGRVMTAQTAMTFTMGLKQTQEPRDPDCPFLCPMAVNGSFVTRAWFLTARVEPTWTITDATGRSFSSPITPTPTPTYMATQPETAVFAVTLDGTEWKVSSQGQSALDNIAQESAEAVIEAKYGAAQNVGGWGTTSGANPADGAVVVIRNGASGPRAVLLWRFGLLYAANSAAKRQFPALSLASQREQALAQTMASVILG